MQQPSSYQGGSPYKALYDLSLPTQALDNSFMPWGIDPCALRFAIFVQGAPRTVSKVDCISSTPVTTLAPSCKDYSFQACKCTDAGCGNCTLTDGNYLSKLVWMGDFIELWGSGYTSQNDKPYIPTILKIKTAKDSNNYFIETISLPAIPLQKWTVITIVKEGRRIDVYYGANPVASSYTNYVPVPANSSVNTYAGNTAWKGSVGFFHGTLGTRNGDDVAADVSAIVDTRGVPYYLEQMNFDFSLNIPFCPLGNCNTLPTVKPRNPFAVYDSTVS
jgi:hypothetical protein